MGNNLEGYDQDVIIISSERLLKKIDKDISGPLWLEHGVTSRSLNVTKLSGESLLFKLSKIDESETPTVLVVIIDNFDELIKVISGGNRPVVYHTYGRADWVEWVEPLLGLSIMTSCSRSTEDVINKVIEIFSSFDHVAREKTSTQK